MKRIFIYIIFLLIGPSIGAQDALTNSGSLQIHTGASVSAFGNFTNASTASLVNNASFYVHGNISNDESSMASGTGTLLLNGSSAQSVNGTQSFRTFNFTSNNASGITLNNNLSVSGVHTFTNGMIVTSATPNYLVYEAGSSYSGDNNSRHVNGWVKKIGSTNFIFPVGNGTVERTVGINSLSANSEFNVTYRGANTPNYQQRQSPLTMVNRYEHWPITKISGGSATVTMNWDYSKVYFPNWIVPDIVAGEWNGSVWAPIGGTASGTTTTTGTITSNSISSFTLFAFASQSWVLPLTLLDFKATRKDNHTLVEWSTEKEINTSHFTVERSDDGSSFYAIARVNARNSGKTELYATKDHAPIQKIAYYRLRITDADGQEKFSRVVAVTDGKTNDKLLLLTNPVRSKITLVANPSLQGEFRYQLSSINGQLVQQGNLFIKNGGQYEIAIDGKVQKGTYSLKVTNQEQTFIYKILIF